MALTRIVSLTKDDMSETLNQQIQYSEVPVPHFIIDNFLSTNMVRAFLEFSVKNKEKFKPADVGNSTTQYFDDCDACIAQRKLNALVKRKNDVFYMTNHAGKHDSIIVDGIQKAIEDVSFKNLIKDAPSVFPIIDNCDNIEAILSRHGMCDFYGWHTDNGGGGILKKNRIITFIYYFNTQPQKFTGGELIIAGKTIADQKIIEPKNNRCVIFVSHNTHCVSTVKLESNDFIDGRFAVNYWVGFK